MSGFRIAYRRVSTLDQSTARQLDGEAFDLVFEDKASGKDTNRPQLQALLAQARKGDQVFVHSMDRLARNTVDLLQTVRTLTDRGVTITFKKENLTFGGEADPFRELMLTLLGAFAQFERDLIRERQREGQAILKRNGGVSLKTGNKAGRPKRTLEPAQVREAMARVEAGETITDVAADLHVSREFLRPLLKDLGYVPKAAPAVRGPGRTKAQ